MEKHEVQTIIDHAIQGNYFPFNRFFEETFQTLHPKLERLTTTEEDIKDMYLVSMQKFWERFVLQQEAIPDNSVGYIYRMCKNAFLLKKREAWASVILSEDPMMDQAVQWEDTLGNEEEKRDAHAEFLQFKALEIALETLSPKCKALMEEALDTETKLKDVVDTFGYTNYQALVQAKYNCKKRLVKKVAEVLQALTTKKMVK